MEDRERHLKIQLKGMGEDSQINKYELYNFIENIIVNKGLSEEITEEIWGSRIFNKEFNLDIDELHDYIIKVR